MLLRFIILTLLFTPQIRGDSWKRVYLATFTRSGNHWMRHLLEEATGFATSSVYQDKDPYPHEEPHHLPDPFPWGGYCPPNGYDGKCRYPVSGDIVVIKTHYPFKPLEPFDLQPRVKVIRIVRHPLDCFFSDYVYGRRPPHPEQIPREFLLYLIHYWKYFQNYWNAQSDVFTVRYEDLLENPKGVVKEVAQQVGYQISEQDIERAVSKHPPEGKPLKHLGRYSESDLSLIKQELKELLEQFNYSLPN